MQIQLQPKLIVPAAGAFAAFAGGRWLTGRQRTWGAIGDEATRHMPGDEVVAMPGHSATRAITVNAPPECIYPWLVQMGYRRGGLYSYDILDRLFGFLDGPSAKRILPEFQNLAAGGSIPIGRGAPFPVAELRESEVFVLGDLEAGWSWSTCLYREADGTTRLVTRNRARVEGWHMRALVFVVDLAAFIMVRRWLVVLQGRAEALASELSVRPASDDGPPEELFASLHRRRAGRPTC